MPCSCIAVSIAGVLIDRSLRWLASQVSKRLMRTATRQNTTGGGERDAQIAFDRRFVCARNRPALDRPGHGCHRLAEGKLHDQPDPVGRIWRGARGRGPHPDLAKPALNGRLENRRRNSAFRFATQGRGRERGQPGTEPLALELKSPGTVRGFSLRQPDFETLLYLGHSVHAAHVLDCS